MTSTVVASLAVVAVLLIILAVLRLRRVSFPALVMGLIGAVLGLLLGALASVPLSKLPGVFGTVMPLAVTVAFTIGLVGVMLSRRDLVGNLMPHKQQPASGSKLPRILVDTSVIIDGRIADIARTGFVPGRLIVPRFVLAELQNIADSEDAMRRGRGRRGLDVLNQLREMRDVEVEVIDDDVPGVREVDAKLVDLGKRFGSSVLTTDYNLNQVAQIQGVRVLNVNELSNAIRPVVLPGETLMVRVAQAGKERGQGVGYLADGTMIVVENGDKLIGQEVQTEVTRVFQTVAGKMIFAIPKNHHQAAKSQPTPSEQQTQKSEQPEQPRRRMGRHNKVKRPPETGDIEGRIIAATESPERHSQG